MKQKRLVWSAGSRQGVACADRRVFFSAEIIPSFISRPLDRLQNGQKVILILSEFSNEAQRYLTLPMAYRLLSLTINAPS